MKKFISLMLCMVILGFTTSAMATDIHEWEFGAENMVDEITLSFVSAGPLMEESDFHWEITLTNVADMVLLGSDLMLVSPGIYFFPGATISVNTDTFLTWAGESVPIPANTRMYLDEMLDGQGGVIEFHRIIGLSPIASAIEWGQGFPSNRVIPIYSFATDIRQPSTTESELVTDIYVVLDGTRIIFDVPPQVVDGRTLVPLRAIFEALGAEVNWNEATQTVTATKGDTTVVLPIGSTSPTVSGQTVTIDVPASVLNGRTLVPLRFVAESFGVSVDWNSDTRTITITS
ncbi:MAG: stalk domain-containing protein [Oscillospiraceae bacterium]|nr:stalk domain-containing protein [Oscillospiraceae bacterium]